MKRPDGIKVTTALMAVAVFLHLVAALASPLPIGMNEEHGVIRFLMTVLAAALAGVVVVIFESVVLWYYWRGLNWARWAAVAGCLLCFVSLRHFFGGPTVSRGREVIIFYRIGIAIFIMGYLTTEPARRWFARLRKRT